MRILLISQLVQHVLGRARPGCPAGSSSGPGGQEYAAENGTFGVATIRREHITSAGGQLVFSYPAKGSQQREQSVVEGYLGDTRTS